MSGARIKDETMALMVALPHLVPRDTEVELDLLDSVADRDRLDLEVGRLRLDHLESARGVGDLDRRPSDIST